MKYKIEGDGAGKSKTHGYPEKNGWADPAALETHPGSCVGQILREKELAGVRNAVGSGEVGGSLILFSIHKSV